MPTLKLSFEAIKVSMVRGKLTVAATLPIYARSEPNNRDHRFARAARVKEQRGAAMLILTVARSYLQGAVAEAKPLTITLTRVRPKGKQPLDTDNLGTSLKALRDGVADAIDVNDNHELLKWVYAQAVGDDYAVRIDITSGRKRNGQ